MKFLFQTLSTPFLQLDDSNLLHPALLLLYFSKSDPEIQQMLLYSNSNTQ